MINGCLFVRPPFWPLCVKGSANTFYSWEKLTYKTNKIFVHIWALIKCSCSVHKVWWNVKNFVFLTALKYKSLETSLAKTRPNNLKNISILQNNCFSWHLPTFHLSSNFHLSRYHAIWAKAHHSRVLSETN